MDNIAVVTGAGSGVGQAIALKLAALGYSVALLGRRADALQSTIALAAAHSQNMLSYPCDVASETQVRAAAEHIREDFGDPNVLVNSAGTNIARRSLAELSPDDYRRLIDVNLNGAFYCTHAFLPAFRRRAQGTIVNIVSDAGLYANRISGPAYIASKFGLVGLTAAINAEERKNGIRACALCPGEINTPLLDQRPQPPSAEARARMLQPEDVADCALLAIQLPPRAILEQLLLRPA